MAKSLRTNVLEYAKKQYGTTSDRPWKRYPENEVLRHEDTQKWYGLIFPVERKKLGVSGTGVVDILSYPRTARDYKQLELCVESLKRRENLNHDAQM